MVAVCNSGCEVLLQAGVLRRWSRFAALAMCGWGTAAEGRVRQNALWLRCRWLGHRLDGRALPCLLSPAECTMGVSFNLNYR
jgi:hypothetical protein